MALFEFDGMRPEVPASAYVAENASVIGQVRLGEEASVWFGAVLRGDNATITIGDRSNVQDGCVLHVDPGFPLEVGIDCTIGHRVVLHGCTVGDRSLIGMGAVLLNGCRIGADCLVGAGALVTEGKTFPDGVLIVGSPGRVVRALTAEEIARLRIPRESYTTKIPLYRRSLRLLEPMPAA